MKSVLTPFFFLVGRNFVPHAGSGSTVHEPALYHCMPSKRKSRRPVAVRPAKAKKASTARVASTAAPAPGVALAATMRAINASCEARVQSPFAAVDNFDAFFTKISAHCLASPSPSERAQYFLFLTNCFRSLENVAVREVVLQTTGLASWRSLTAAKLAIELAANPALQQRWAKLAAPRPVDAFMPRLIAHFFSVVDASAPGDASAELKDFVNRFLELIIGVVSQLHTRRFVRPLLDDANFELRCRFAPLLRYSLATKLLDLLHRRLRFEVDDPTGEAKTELEVLQEHYAAVCALQRVAFKHFGAELRELCLSSVGQLGSRAALLAHLEQLSDSQLVALAAHVKLSLGRLADGGNGNGEEGSTASSKASGSVGKRRMALEVLVRSLAKPASRIEQVNALSLYPSEALLWDDERVPFDYRGAGVLALPKLGLHYMTLHDYLERCFTLFRFEAATQIRAHLVSAISRMVPSRVEDRSGAPSARFGGWSRDAVPVSDFELVEVGRPDVGSLVPSVVKATLTISLARFQGPVLGDWCKLQEHDVVFLVAIRPPARPRGAGGGGGGARAPKPGDDPAYATKTGVLFVRGAEVVEVQDGKGETIRRRGASGAGAADAAARGSTRRLVLHLDPAQYTQDQAALAAGRSATASPAAGADGADALLDLQGVLHDDPYGAGVINLLVRRSAKENNFKAVLQTVRDIMNVEAVGKGTALPSWLHDVFLGVGDPAAASPEALPARMHTFDIRSTLVSAQHAAASFPTKTVLFACEGGALVEASEAVAKGVAPPPPYRIRTAKEGSVVLSSSSTFSSAAAAAAAAAAAHARGERERRNAVEFSPTQVRAILSGMNVGLTCVCGPPGTGKTDVAVQIVSNLYANFPKQRILLVAHSNQALNDLFEKITERDIDPRHLIRLGRGERELRERTDADFSINGRVAYTLERRQLLLNNVRRIAETLGVPGASDVAYTCETAEHFQLFHVVSRVEAFELAVAAQASPPPPGSVAALFPFVAYVAASGTTPGLFAGVSFEDDLSAARRSFRQIESMFEELADFRAFELLRTSRQREDYLLTKQARIVALTCTHAALARRRLIRLNFKVRRRVSSLPLRFPSPPPPSAVTLPARAVLTLPPPPLAPSCSLTASSWRRPPRYSTSRPSFLSSFSRAGWKAR